MATAVAAVSVRGGDGHASSGGRAPPADAPTPASAPAPGKTIRGGVTRPSSARPIILASEREDDDDILESSRGSEDDDTGAGAAAPASCSIDGGAASAGMIGAERRVPRRMRRRSKMLPTAAAMTTAAAATVAPATAAVDMPDCGTACDGATVGLGRYMVEAEMLAALTVSDDSAAATTGSVSAAVANDDAKAAATAAGFAWIAAAVASQAALPALPGASGVIKKSMTTPGRVDGRALTTAGCSTRRANTVAEIPVMVICDGGRDRAAANARISASSTAGSRSNAAETPDTVKTTNKAG